MVRCHLVPSPEPSDAESNDVFAIGEVLSDTYEIRAVIGDGAMGQVFDAQDQRLNRRVAIKVAWPHVGCSAIRLEAQALAAIRHPGLVTVYAINVHRGHEYVVMDLIRGVTLEEHLVRSRQTDEPMSVARVLKLLMAITDALSAVHRAGLVHRDLKPANVMVGAGDQITLVDFGLFLPQFEPGKQEKVVGSPTYMAPELIRNKVESGSWHLVDIYALGVLAFELLAGEPPFPGESVRDVFAAHVRKEVPDLTETRADIPPGLAALIREMLAKAPGERPQTGEAILRSLQTLRDKLEEDVAKAPFVVLVASPNRAQARALAGALRRVVPDAEVRTAQDAETVIEHTEFHLPDVALVDASLPGDELIELCMFLRGSAPGVVLGLLGDPQSAGDLGLLTHLDAHFVPPMGSDDLGLVHSLVRAARRTRR
ncbi:MAG: protein kinase [Deltaproteobacteria bacterium]|nr:protein kinase [Deltaproteobacteria bacterium]